MGNSGWGNTIKITHYCTWSDSVYLWYFGQSIICCHWLLLVVVVVGCCWFGWLLVIFPTSKRGNKCISRILFTFQTLWRFYPQAWCDAAGRDSAVVSVFLFGNPFLKMYYSIFFNGRREILRAGNLHTNYQFIIDWLVIIIMRRGWCIFGAGYGRLLELQLEIFFAADRIWQIGRMAQLGLESYMAGLQFTILMKCREIVPYFSKSRHQ